MNNPVSKAWCREEQKMKPERSQENLSCKMIASLMRFRKMRSGANMRANSQKDRPILRLSGRASDEMVCGSTPSEV